jgi:hypothetical protein
MKPAAPAIKFGWRSLCEHAAPVSTPLSGGRFKGGCNFSKLGGSRWKTEKPAESTTIKGTGKPCKDRRKWLWRKELRRASLHGRSRNHHVSVIVALAEGGKYLQRSRAAGISARNRAARRQSNTRRFAAKSCASAGKYLCWLCHVQRHFGTAVALCPTQRRTAERQPSGWNHKSHVSKEVCLLQTPVRPTRRDGPS